jgi:very-short-patch-repair endonuclease
LERRIGVFANLRRRRLAERAAPASSSPLVGEGGSARSAETDEGFFAMPHQIVRPRHRRHARAMRHAATEAELRLWNQVRDRRLGGAKFRRQVPIGGFIADFVCAEAKLIVEIDGVQHAESAYDAARDAKLKERGFRVLRFWNGDVMHDLDSVCATILAYVSNPGLEPE